MNLSEFIDIFSNCYLHYIDNFHYSRSALHRRRRPASSSRTPSTRPKPHGPAPKYKRRPGQSGEARSGASSSPGEAHPDGDASVNPARPNPSPTLRAGDDSGPWAGSRTVALPPIRRYELPENSPGMVPLDERAGSFGRLEQPDHII